jgi:hypothetical protein
MTRPRIEALPVHRSARILYGKLEVVRYRTCRVAARFLKGRVVRALWVQLERPDRRGAPSEERLLVCTDPDLPATEVITSYAKRWSVEPLFAAMKHGWGLKDAWQQSRQVLMRWVTILAAGYALSQMLAYTDPARIPGLAAPAPWRPPGTRTAGLIQAGLIRLPKISETCFPNPGTGGDWDGERDGASRLGTGGAQPAQAGPAPGNRQRP